MIRNLFQALWKFSHTGVGRDYGNRNNMLKTRYRLLNLDTYLGRKSSTRCFEYKEFEVLKRGSQKFRPGAATVELALILPVFLLSIILPMIEFSRALIVSSCVASAAQVGCRAAVLPGSTNASVGTAVSNSLTVMQIKGSNPTVIKVNGGATELSEAVQGDEISVTVSVPYNNASWMPLSLCQFLGNATSVSNQVMRRE